jgi:hypothetical protein
VGSWRPVSVGRRPVDYVQRDAMSAVIFRDPRSWHARKCLGNRPDWMVADAPQLTQEQLQALFVQRTLHYLYAARLLDARSDAEAREQRRIDRILGCWPSGMEVEWQGRGVKSRIDHCGKLRFCPFCFAREATRIWRLLTEYGRCRPRRSFLALFRASVDLMDLARSSHVDATQEAARHAKYELTAALRKTAAQFGGTGGLCVAQFAPDRSDVPVWQSNDELAMRSDAGLRLVVTCLAELTDPRGLARLEGEDHIGVEQVCSLAGRPIHARLRVVTWPLASQPGDPVRLMLIAPTSRENASRDETLGGGGALTWAPWTLSTAAQWLQHWRVAGGMHLYGPWGSWKSIFRRQRLQLHFLRTRCGQAASWRRIW